jgi:hypothetical protein
MVVMKSSVFYDVTPLLFSSLCSKVHLNSSCQAFQSTAVLIFSDACTYFAHFTVHYFVIKHLLFNYYIANLFLFSEDKVAIVNLYRAIQYRQPKVAKKILTNR